MTDTTIRRLDLRCQVCSTPASAYTYDPDGQPPVTYFCDLHRPDDAIDLHTWGSRDLDGEEASRAAEQVYIEGSRLTDEIGQFRIGAQVGAAVILEATTGVLYAARFPTTYADATLIVEEVRL